MEGINTKKLLRNFFSLSFVQGVNSLLQLLVVPYVISRIGVENFGVVAVAQVVMFFLGSFTEYGFGQAGAREVSLNRKDKQKLSVIFFNSLYTKLLLCLIAFAALLLLAVVFPVLRQHPVLYGMAFIYVIGQASFPSWFFQGMEKMQWVAISTLFSKLLFVALVFLFIKRPEHAVLYTFFLGLGNLIAGIVSSVVAVRMFGLHHTRLSSQRVISTLKESWPITATNLSMNFMQYGNLFILRLFTNDLIAGYFSVAERVYFAMKQVLTAFSQTIYPNVCQLADESGEKLKHYFKKIFTPFFIMIIIASGAVMLLAPYIISFFIHEQNDKAVFILRMLCIAVPVVCLNIPGSLTLLAFDKKKSYFMIYVSGFLLCIIANLCLVPVFGSSGTIASILITELVITTGVTYGLLRILNKSVMNKTT